MGIEKVMESVVEKLKEALLTVEKWGALALAWFDGVSPPETRADNINHWFHVAKMYLIVAVVLYVVVRFCRSCGGLKMMKVPAGRNHRMPGRDIETYPKGDASILSLPMADDLHMKLLYLENRVAFMRLFFPTEAKLAMEIALAEPTFGLAGLLSSRSGNLMEVDLNETPISQNKLLLSRIETLCRTVELGRRYVPHCSQVLDKFMEDDLQDAIYLEKCTPEEQRLKRMHFMELKDEVQRAFSKDKSELHRSESIQ